MTTIIRQLFDKESSTYTYLIADADTREAVLIDPVLEQVDRDIQLMEQMDITLRWVLETHVHADHVTAASELRHRTGAKTAASAIGAPCVDRHLIDGDVIEVGSLRITALATPGHTDDGMTFELGNNLFTGDTLLIRGCGRSDFQNGDPGRLYDSITGVLFKRPSTTVIWPGHDYRGFTSSTVGEELCHNPRVAHRSRDEFIAIMNALELPYPKKLDVAVPANKACGNVDAVRA
jgi:sulfur dioxygenase